MAKNLIHKATRVSAYILAPLCAGLFAFIAMTLWVPFLPNDLIGSMPNLSKTMGRIGTHSAGNVVYHSARGGAYGMILTAILFFGLAILVMGSSLLLGLLAGFVVLALFSLFSPGCSNKGHKIILWSALCGMFGGGIASGKTVPAAEQWLALHHLSLSWISLGFVIALGSAFVALFIFLWTVAKKRQRPGKATWGSS